MNYIIWLLISGFFLISSPTFASDALVHGGLDSIININVQTDNQLKSQVPDIRTSSTPPLGSTVAKIYCDNNNYNGFSLTFVSDRQGRLVFFKNNQYESENKEGQFINYTLDLVEGDSGELGLSMPAENERRGFSLFNPFVINFNDNITTATHQAELILKMHLIKKSTLFHGVFQDTITITITDL